MDVPGLTRTQHELRGHRELTAPLLTDRRVPRLVQLHGQPGRPSSTWLAERRDRALRWLTHPHRMPHDVVERVRAFGCADGQVDLVPTHGDLSPRNWVVHDGVISFIDLGRADLRPRATDLFRLQDRSWRGRPDLERAFFTGYGADPRDVWWWPSLVLAEHIGTAVWAHQVGDEAFEAKGLRGLREVFPAGP
ncbi:phosphotransferase family protein [Ornithinimicrobium pratense]|uniref:phosphotransferase family protein n=1 Tax=Ornithinimicrobium pratense TaxID=2593973 RepID=UPI001788884B|nr:phosphotransferase [Ornithinimicrobium pratense]